MNGNKLFLLIDAVIIRLKDVFSKVIVMLLSRRFYNIDRGGGGLVDAHFVV